MELTISQPIQENLWWIIPGKLAGVRMPTSEELPELQAAGVGAIVSVFHNSDNLSLYQEAGIPHLWLPIEIDSVPNPVQIQEFQHFVESQNRLGHAVAVHCSTGKHRTGTMLAAYLIEVGLSYESAMKTILDANPSIELPKNQAIFLQELAQIKKSPIEQSIVENLWWVIPGKLAGVRKPTAEEIAELKATGVGAIVSVMDDPSNLDLYEQTDLPYRWLPTKGGKAPNSEQIQELQKFVEQQNQIGNAVAVHCTTGNRRTGTMLAAYLIITGSSYDNAMRVVQTANPKAELRAAQATFLHELVGEVSGDSI
jgi:protein-tyrosine phosphatase